MHKLNCGFLSQCRTELQILLYLPPISTKAVRPCASVKSSYSALGHSQIRFKMGGGDLNMKKSWHPGLIKNRAQVWEAQNAALQERKRVEALKKEIEEERAANELQRLNEANGGAKRQERVDFLYAGPGAGSGLQEDREAYLLGRKRIDDVLGKDNLGQELAQAKGAVTTTKPSELNMRDVTNKISQDPLLAIKRQEAAQHELMVNRRKAELEAEARKAARRESRYAKDEDRHRSSRNRESERSSYRSGEDADRHRSSHRSSHRYRSSSRDRDQRRHRHSRSSRDRSREDTTRRRRRSRSPDEYDRSRRRSRSRDYASSRSARRERSYTRSPNRDSPHTSNTKIGGYSETVPVDNEASRAAKLAAMTNAASDLDEVRQRRLDEARKRDEADRAREDAARSREARVGENSGFVRNMQLSAGLVR